MALRSVVIISDPTVFPPVSPLPPVPSPSFPFECSDPHDAVPAILVFRSRGITLKTHELSINNVIVSGALRSAAGTNDWASNWVLVPKKTLQNSHNILRIHNGSPAFSSSAESFRLDDVVILYESTGAEPSDAPDPVAPDIFSPAPGPDLPSPVWFQWTANDTPVDFWWLEVEPEDLEPVENWRLAGPLAKRREASQDCLPNGV